MVDLLGNRVVRYGVGALLLRVLLIWHYKHSPMTWRPEIVTPVNNILQVREGLRLMQLRMSPYSSSNVHVPPPLFLLFSAFPGKPWDHLALLLTDILASATLYSVATSINRACKGGKGLSPLQMAALYLCNPLTIMGCVGGSISCMENLAVFCALRFALERNLALCSFFVIVGGFFSPHVLLLSIPLVLMLHHGPLDLPILLQPPVPVTNAIGPGAEPPPLGASASVPGTKPPPRGATASVPGSKPPPPRASASGPGASSSRRWPRSLPGLALAFLAFSAAWFLALMWLSDAVLARFPQHHCVRPFLPASVSTLLLPPPLSPGSATGIRTLSTTTAPASVPSAATSPTAAAAAATAGTTTAPGPAFAASAAAGAAAASAPSTPRAAGSTLTATPGAQSCWLPRAYGIILSIDDITPNIGLTWYFFMELFSSFKPFFAFVFHSQAVIMCAPLALRLPRQPLLLLVAQLLSSSLFRPYPSAGDVAGYIALLPLLRPQLGLMRSGAFLIGSFALLAVLGPAMWHQWIIVDAANSNFYYSITLLFGAWQVLLLVQLLMAAIRLEEGQTALDLGPATAEAPAVDPGPGTKPT